METQQVSLTHEGGWKLLLDIRYDIVLANILKVIGLSILLLISLELERIIHLLEKLVVLCK